MTPGSFKTSRAPGRRLQADASGFAILEAILATVVVALVLVAAMRVTAASNLAQYKAAERVTGRTLAQALMTEIYQLAYEDPSTPVLFGREANELTAAKTALDDIDDFNGYTETPPKDKDNATIAGTTGWTRSVAVAWVPLTDATSSSLIETGLKRITVTVKRGNAVVATLVAVKSKAP
jgi:hypothetical protein